MSVVMRVSVRGWREPFDVESVGPGRIRVQGTEASSSCEVTVSAIDGGVMLTDPTWSRPKRVRIARDADRAWVLVDGEVFECRQAPPRERHSVAPAGPEALCAPMPATVVRVAVDVGQRVAKDAVLVVLDAMKMELAIKAPHAGVVAHVGCAVGQLVSPDQTLVSLDPAG